MSDAIYTGDSGGDNYTPPEDYTGGGGGGAQAPVDYSAGAEAGGGAKSPSIWDSATSALSSAGDWMNTNIDQPVSSFLSQPTGDALNQVGNFFSGLAGGEPAAAAETPPPQESGLTPQETQVADMMSPEQIANETQNTLQNYPQPAQGDHFSDHIAQADGWSNMLNPGEEAAPPVDLAGQDIQAFQGDQTQAPATSGTVGSLLPSQGMPSIANQWQPGTTSGPGTVEIGSMPTAPVSAAAPGGSPVRADLADVAATGQAMHQQFQSEMGPSAPATPSAPVGGGGGGAPLPSILNQPSQTGQPTDQTQAGTAGAPPTGTTTPYGQQNNANAYGQPGVPSSVTAPLSLSDFAGVSPDKQAGALALLQQSQTGGMGAAPDMSDAAKRAQLVSTLTGEYNPNPPTSGILDSAWNVVKGIPAEVASFPVTGLPAVAGAATNLLPPVMAANALLSEGAKFGNPGLSAVGAPSYVRVPPNVGNLVSTGVQDVVTNPINNYFKSNYGTDLEGTMQVGMGMGTPEQENQQASFQANQGINARIAALVQGGQSQADAASQALEEYAVNMNQAGPWNPSNIAAVRGMAAGTSDSSAIASNNPLRARVAGSPLGR